MSTAVLERDGTAPPRRLPRQAWVAAGLLVAVVVVLRLLEVTGHARTRGVVVTGPAAQVVAAVTVLLGVGLLALALVGRAPGGPARVGGRDLRIDLLRGTAIVFVVLDHLPHPSLLHLLSQEAVGPVSGAELFVTMSGLVVGMVYRGRLAASDLVAVTGALLRRAFTLYRTAVVLVLVVYLLTLLPGVDGRVVTTYRGGGRDYDQYPNIGHLRDYPVPGYLVRDLLRLQLGPYQFNVMGLYVVLLALAPLLVAALSRRLWPAVLSVSWTVYVLNAVHPVHLLPSQFEVPFPLLTWQVLFVTGAVVGWHRAAVVAWFRRPRGRVLLVLVVLAHLAMLLFAWCTSFLDNGYDVRLDLISTARFDALYTRWCTRPTLGLGRLLDVGLLLVTAYAFLTAYWRPVERAVGWFLVPLGQASLYVFTLHVVAVLVLANVPGLDGPSVALATLSQGVVLALLWTAVRRRFLFLVIPR